MSKVMHWSMEKFCLMVIEMLLNKFDCFIAIEGNRGLGKSTLAYEICKQVKNTMRHIADETGGKESPYYNWYQFKPELQAKNRSSKFVLYKREDVINFFDKWHHTCISDEMINVAFNRDFWSEDQKNLIRLINMNRDHCNLFIACVPQFQVLDNQIKNLCKIRLTVVRRGLAMIQTPNRTIYNKDKWDTANNERIEREWLRKGSGLPQYSKLNTFRGTLKFPALSEREQQIYDTIKLQERNTIKKDLGVTDDKKESKEVIDIAMERLLAGKIRNSHILDGLALSQGIDPDNFKNQMRKRLTKQGISNSLPSYFWEKKARKEAETTDLAPISS